MGGDWEWQWDRIRRKVGGKSQLIDHPTKSLFEHHMNNIIEQAVARAQTNPNDPIFQLLRTYGGPKKN